MRRMAASGARVGGARDIILSAPHDGQRRTAIVPAGGRTRRATAGYQTGWRRPPGPPRTIHPALNTMLNQASRTPAEVGPSDDELRLRIRWRDGHVSEYMPRELRLQCPCAGCIEEMTGRPLLDPRTVAEDVYPVEIEHVGRYALRFAWSDGHGTGIFPFDMLRRICPCESCAADV